jgi:hypothetical protein
MKIIVIGKSARIRGEIVQRLRDEGHEAATPSPLRGRASAASRDPGHAGRHLRQFLESAGARLVQFWRTPRVRRRQGLWPDGRFEDGHR